MFSWHVVALIDEETCKMQHFLTLALASSTAEVVSLSNQLIALNIIKDLSDQKKSINLCLMFVVCSSTIVVGTSLVYHRRAVMILVCVQDLHNKHE